MAPDDAADVLMVFPRKLVLALALLPLPGLVLEREQAIGA
jgi:hypothetical protein